MHLGFERNIFKILIPDPIIQLFKRITVTHFLKNGSDAILFSLSQLTLSSLSAEIDTALKKNMIPVFKCLYD